MYHISLLAFRLFPRRLLVRSSEASYVPLYNHLCRSARHDTLFHQVHGFLHIIVNMFLAGLDTSCGCQRRTGSSFAGHSSGRFSALLAQRTRLLVRCHRILSSLQGALQVAIWSIEYLSVVSRCWYDHPMSRARSLYQVRSR